ncbi:MAG: non-homologous end-joining DNA ligase [Candidatus Dormibacteraeota bacterium]|uniref:DNA ligase (ATP) n=1 Tax=Candidatus Dormiibacter inghamiae TaxID=3127013 RepID=A0A934KH89_9BACT|nr:non-homologous end-joining DNA ligase [Candidatus Dormibacteraeota bacterium]MBJ7607521.1 non-homologous end-joining DNA ligase [Candidatus Dormibacteraeota bacterium]
MADQLSIELDGFPEQIRPMQAVSAEAPFRSPDYLFEVKWDGLRCILFVDPEGAVRVQDRALTDLTAVLPELAQLGRQVKQPAIIDGELVATDEEGRPDYGRLRRRLAAGRPEADQISLGFLAFDLLFAQGRSLLRQPLVRRRARLKKVVTTGGHLFVPDHIEGEGAELFEACLERGLEGIVAKHRNSPYVPGQRSPFWLKIKAVKSDDFVVVASTPGAAGEPFGALLVAYHEQGRLLPCGAVVGGYDDAAASLIARELARLATDECPLLPPPVVAGAVRWCRPQLAISVRYSEWAPDGTLRFPIFNGLRPEVHPAECVRHRPRVVLAGRAAADTPAHQLTRFPF